MRKRVTKEEQNKIQEAIGAFEKRSSAELVSVIAKQSDGYIFVATFYAAIGAVVFPWVYSAFFGKITFAQASLVELIMFVFLLALLQIESLKMLFVPSWLKKQRCRANARENFMKLGLHATKNRAGVMLFVSEAEKYVEIITDVAVAQKIENQEFQAIIDAFIERVKEGEIARGYLECIETIGKMLELHFPYEASQEDELPNTMIFVD